MQPVIQLTLFFFFFNRQFTVNTHTIYLCITIKHVVFDIYFFFRFVIFLSYNVPDTVPYRHVKDVKLSF